MMNLSLGRIQIYEDHQFKKLFLKDPKSDIFAILGNRIFPLHQTVLQDSLFFNNKLRHNQKVFVIQENLNIELFEKILATLYGFSLDFSRTNEAYQILEIVVFLGLGKITEYILNDFNQNFEQYGVFVLFEISKKFALPWLSKKCLQDLVEDKFEQFHINKYDLMNSEKEIFQEILKKHQILKLKGVSLGLDEEVIKGLIEQYKTLNSTKIDVDQILSISLEDEQQAKQTLSCLDVSIRIKQKEKQKQKQKKRRKLTLDQKQLRNSKYSTVLSQHSTANLQGRDQELQMSKNSKIESLKQINTSIIKRCKTMINQIHRAKEKIEREGDQNEEHVESMCVKLKGIEDMFKEQDRKIGKAREIIKQISLKSVSR